MGAIEFNKSKPSTEVSSGTVTPLLCLLCAGAGGGTKRHAWDFKGKVSDMEGKIRNYQTKVKTTNQENEELRSTMAQTQSRVSEMEKKLEKQTRQIRYQGPFPALSKARMTAAITWFL